MIRRFQPRKNAKDSRKETDRRDMQILVEKEVRK